MHKIGRVSREWKGIKKDETVEIIVGGREGSRGTLLVKKVPREFSR